MGSETPDTSSFKPMQVVSGVLLALGFGIPMVMVYKSCDANNRSALANDPALSLWGDRFMAQGAGSGMPADAAASQPFLLGHLEAQNVSDCHTAVDFADPSNRICVFRHACWSSDRPDVISVLPRPDAAAPWPGPDSAHPPGVGYHLKFALRSEARPSGTVVLVKGSAAVMALFQDHMPHFAEAALLWMGLVSQPDMFGSPPLSHLLLEVVSMQAPTHPRAWMHMLLDLMLPQWKSMLFSRPPFVGKQAGLLRAGTPLRNWWDSRAQSMSVLHAGTNSKVAVDLNEDSFKQLSSSAQNYSVCFQELWLAGGLWTFDLHAADTLRQRVRSVLGLPLPSPRHLCIVNRGGSRRITNAGEVADFLSQNSTSRNVRVFTLDGEPPAKQIALISSCALAISPHGAQITNSIFMPRGAVVIEVFSWSMAAVATLLTGGTNTYFAKEAVRAGLVHETVVATRSELDPHAPDSCGSCWNDKWSAYNDTEMRQCTTLGKDTDDCHFCAKNCATRFDVHKHQKTLRRLIRVAEDLMAS
eukprot:m.195506 g.195506  ORF g.195506 m.195506 type:complete len:528 (-) comp19505_c0_seq1:70-1653(-)